MARRVRGQHATPPAPAPTKTPPALMVSVSNDAAPHAANARQAGRGGETRYLLPNGEKVAAEAIA